MSITNLERNVKPVVLFDVTTPQDIKAAPGYLLKIMAYNGDQPTVRFLQIFDCLAADVVLGTTVPVWVIPMQLATVDDNDFGIEFDNAISVACTTDVDNDVAATNGATISALAR